MADSALLEKTDTDIVLDEELKEDDDAPDEEAHFYRKSDLDRNLFDGAAIVALCGHIKRGLAHPNADLPTCEDCKYLMENVVGSNLPKE
jgi:hypothetical protein